MTSCPDDAATHASLNDNHLSLNVGGFIQTGWEYSNGGGLPAQNGLRLTAPVLPSQEI